LIQLGENPLGYDPVAKHGQIEEIVVRKRIGGDQKKYYRFRQDRWYGGIITADCAGCGLACKFCWVRSPSILEGRAQGEFLTARETAEKLLHLMETEKIRQVRISGGEPTVGRDHLLQILNVLMNRRVQFILETNGILIGDDETYAQDLALFPFVHVRVSLKGSSEAEFEKLTGSDAKGFQLQLEALRNLVKAGVSAHPAVMLSFAGREATDKLYHTIWKIDPRMHSEIEREEVILYPHVSEKLRKANLWPVSGHIPEKRPKAKGSERHEGRGQKKGAES
jgi:uncharacterized Fe-S cluster-containing radical SAM superfamily protein